MDGMPKEAAENDTRPADSRDGVPHEPSLMLPSKQEEEYGGLASPARQAEGSSTMPAPAPEPPPLQRFVNRLRSALDLRKQTRLDRIMEALAARQTVLTQTESVPALTASITNNDVQVLLHV